MFISNEAYLINTFYARRTTSSNLKDIDVVELHNISNSVTGLDEDVRGRKVKILEVADIMTVEGSKYTDTPLRVLVDDGFGNYIVCRVTDLLYTDYNIFSIDTDIITKDRNFNITHAVYLPTSTIGRKICSSDRSEIARTVYNVSVDEDSSYAGSIYEKLRSCTFVDSSDSRIKSLNRFYLKAKCRRIVQLTLDYMLDKYQDSVYKYRCCTSCNIIGVTSMNKVNFTGEKLFFCNSCYKDIRVDCDICHYPTRPHYLMSIEKQLPQQVTNIYLDNDIVKACESCINSFYKSCDRCKSAEIIDVEGLREASKLDVEAGGGYEHRNKYVREWSKRLEYIRVNSGIFCISCADIRLSSYLDRPHRYKSLPTYFAGKSHFDRFVGIESEVITEYDSTEDYVESCGEPDYFDVVEDGSLSSGGVEFKTTRPLIGDKVDKALRYLESTNTSDWNSVDSTCGVHIHMNALDFGFRELKSTLLIMSRIQKLIYESIPSNRRSSSYAKTITMSTKDISLINSLSELINKYYAMSDSYIDDHKYNSARYIGTNLHARFFLGSIEFRYHEGSIRSQPIKEWILFLNRIMNKSKTLHKDTKLYRQILSVGNDMDILRSVTGRYGVDYIEKRIDKHK